MAARAKVVTLLSQVALRIGERVSTFVVLGAVLGTLGLACSSVASVPAEIAARGPLDSSAKATPAFSGVSRVELRLRGADGRERVLATTLPATLGIDLPNLDEVGSLVLAGLDASGSTVRYGRSPLLELGGITTATAGSIAISVQNPGELANLAQLPTTPVTPKVAMVGVRALVVADGSSRDLAVLDLLSLKMTTEGAVLDQPPVTIVGVSSGLLVLSATGNAVFLDVVNATRVVPTVLASKFSDVVGGQVIRTGDGGGYVVGPTRTTATSSILRVDPDGSLHFSALIAPRNSASAVYVEGRGLLVSAGNFEGSNRAPELLTPSATIASVSSFASEPSGITALSVTTSSTVVRRIQLNGVVEEFDLSCVSACVPAKLAPLASVAARSDDQIFAVEGEVVLIRNGQLSVVEGTKSPRVVGNLELSAGLVGSTGALLFASKSNRFIRSYRTR